MDLRTHAPRQRLNYYSSRVAMHTSFVPAREESANPVNVHEVTAVHGSRLGPAHQSRVPRPMSHVSPYAPVPSLGGTERLHAA
jgi:hypothetical protein